MKVPCQLASRDSIRAFYSDGIVVILATGSASAGERIDIDMVRPSTTPLEFLLERCQKPGVWPDVMRPYSYCESFVLTRHPDRVRIGGTIRVHHQDGVDDVRLEPFPEDLQILRQSTAAPGGRRTATGYSSNLSFDEAFAEAVKILGAGGASHPDELLHVKVEEVGGLFGGLAGFNDLYVRLVVEGAGGGGPIEEIAPERLAGRPGDVVSEVAPGRPYRPDPEIIVEVAPPPEGKGGPGPGEVIVEVAPQYERARPRPGDVIVEVAPDQESRARPRPGDVIVEVAPDQESRARPRPGDVIVEVAPDQESRPRPGDVIVEVAPDRPYPAGGEGPIVEVGPDRPYPAGGGEGPIVEVGPDRPEEARGNGPIVEVGPERAEGERRHGPITEVAPDRPEDR